MNILMPNVQIAGNKWVKCYNFVKQSVNSQEPPEKWALPSMGLDKLECSEWGQFSLSYKAQSTEAAVPGLWL